MSKEQRDLLASGLHAAIGAQIVIEAWAQERGCDPCNYDNCRLTDWIKAAQQFQETKTQREKGTNRTNENRNTDS